MKARVNFAVKKYTINLGRIYRNNMAAIDNHGSKISRFWRVPIRWNSICSNQTSCISNPQMMPFWVARCEMKPKPCCNARDALVSRASAALAKHHFFQLHWFTVCRREKEGRKRERERERDPFHFGTKYYLPWQKRSVASSTLSREEKSWWHRWLNQISLGRILATGMPLQWLLMRSLTLIYFQRQSCK